MSIMITCLGRTKEHNAEVGGVPTSYHVAENTPTGTVQAGDVVPMVSDHVFCYYGGSICAEWKTGNIDERLKDVIRIVAMRLEGIPINPPAEWYTKLKWIIDNRMTGVQCIIHDAGSGVHAHIEIQPKKGFEVELV